MGNKILTAFFLAFAMLCGVETGVAQNLEWAKHMGSGQTSGVSITTDANGNVYTTGYFYGTVDFDPGTGIYNLSSAGSCDAFVCKLDAFGNFVWAKKFGSASIDQGTSIAIDAFGYVYTVGGFQGTVDFNPGIGIYNLTSIGGTDVFISKLDASGNFVWAKKIGGNGSDYAVSIFIDSDGSLYTTGSFQSTVDFNPNAGVYSLNAIGLVDIFINKLDTAGNFKWARSMGGSLQESGRSITVSGSSVYTLGDFQGTVDFDPGAGIFNLTSDGGYDIFVSKLDTAGNFFWAKKFGGTSEQYGKSIVADGSGNVYTTGYFQGTADFNPDTTVVYSLVSAGNNDVFISKLDASGDFGWAKRIGGTFGDECYSITIDSLANVYTIGVFNGNVDFNPDTSIVHNLLGLSDDVFVCKFDSSGAFVVASKISGYGIDWGNSITIDNSENLYITGYFQGTADFEPGVGTYNLSAYGNSDLFVAKYKQPNPIQIAITPNDASCNQSNGGAQASVNGGTLPYHFLWSNGDTTNIADSLGAGIYSLVVTDSNGLSNVAYFAINNIGGFTISGITQDVHCIGGSDGAIDLTIVGGTGPFTVNWSNGATSQDISGLVAADYDVNITDTTGCMSAASFTVLDGVTVTHTNIITNPGCGLNNGSIALTPLGGVLPYTYQWTGGQTTSTISGVGAGIYTVTIYDANMCSEVAAILLNSSNAPIITTDSVESSPCGGTGAAYITVTGGVLPMQYHWSNAYNGEDLIGYSPGNYTVTVTGNDSCKAVAQVAIPTTLLPIQPICMLTVDSISHRNKIVWEKISPTGVDYYKIYRETSVPDQYLLVDTVHNTSMSQFTDLAANPFLRSWRYKISQVDICGNESPLSDSHKTIHLTINHGLGNSFNLIFDDYEGFNYSTFYVFCHTNQFGWVILDSLPRTLHSFTNIPTSLGGLKYFVVIKKPDTCFAGINKDQTETYNISISNMEEYQIIGINESQNNFFSMNIFPNPASENITITASFNRSENLHIEIADILGKTLFKINEKVVSGKFNKTINLKSFSSGIYFVTLKTSEGMEVKKIFKNYKNE